MNNNKISIFKCFFFSITSFDKYRLFLRQSTGKAVGYLILLSLLLSIAIFAPIYTLSNEIVSEAPTFIAENLPDFSLADGHLEVYGQMPIVMESSDTPIIIDTTPGAEDRLLHKYDSVILITHDKMILKNYVNRQEYPHSAYTGLNLTRDSLIEALPIIKTYMTIAFIFVGIFVGIFFVIGKFIAAFVVSIIGLIANSALKTNLSYRSIFKISIFSMTLPLIICTVLDILPITIPFLSVLFYIGSGIFVFGAINSIKRGLNAAGSDGYGFYGNDTFSGTKYGNSNLGNYNYGNNNPTGNNDKDANNTPSEDRSVNGNDDNNDKTE